MNKQTTTLLTVGAVAAVGYLVWKQSQKPKAFANLMMAAPSVADMQEVAKCQKGYREKFGEWYVCCSGWHKSKDSVDKKCNPQQQEAL